MAVPTTRTLEPIYAEASLADANNGNANWARGEISPLDQKSNTGWLACLYGGIQTGDDWARVNIPVFEQRVPDFNTAQWSYYLTNTETMGVNIVIWVHDPKDFDKRAEITQLGSTVTVTAGWNAEQFTTATTGMFYYGENVTLPDGTATDLTAGTQYTWAQFQTDNVFSTWTIYRITLEYGWEASGTFEEAYVADIKLNGMPIFLRPDSGGSGRIAKRSVTATTSAIANTLAPKTPFRLLSFDIEINTAGTTSESLTITKDALAGATYDVLILTQNTKTPAITSLHVPFGVGYEYEGGDELDCAWPNTENRTYGLTWTYQTVF
ncbi:hypothetical protein LCGC14_1653590 [marine sediment metagenome]|uniref:Uncharacterized protein n=1 Tax=marine sediment metagenome TaxID=412755 RepID=A0A0F9IIR0_9ZZZZ